MLSLAARRVVNGHNRPVIYHRGPKAYIIGIIVAAVVVVIAAVVLIAFCCLRRRQNRTGPGAATAEKRGLFSRIGGYAKIGDQEKSQAEEAWPEVPMSTNMSRGDSGLDMEQETGYHSYSESGASDLYRSSSGHTVPPPYNAVRDTDAQGTNITDVKVEQDSPQSDGGSSLEVSGGGRPRANSKFVEQID